MSKILSLNVRVKVVMTLQLPAAIATRSLDSQTRSEFYGVCGLCVCVLSGFVTGSGASYRKERPVYHFIMLKKGFVETRYIYFDEPPCYLRQRFSERGRSGRM